VKHLALLRGRLNFVNLAENRSQSRFDSIHKLVGKRSSSCRETRRWTQEAIQQLRKWKDSYLKDTKNKRNVEKPIQFVGASDASDTGIGYIWTTRRGSKKFNSPTSKNPQITVKQLKAAN
jgi:hypothetical protein